MTTIKPKLSKDVCRDAIETWGDERQLDMVVEELSELTKALMKLRRYGHTEEWRRKTVEEAADVSIMLEQLVMMLSSTEEFEKVRRYKLQRLEKLIDCETGNQTCENDSGENDWDSWLEL